MIKKIALGMLIMVLLAAAGFTAWASLINPILPEAVAALQSDGQVQVEPQPAGGDWLVFSPAGEQAETGLIFYPGGRVDYRAYAPYARAVASRGYLVVIPRMPLNLAVFKPNEAASIIQAYPEVRSWAVGGHSLGGAMAANYAAQHPGEVQALVLLASYPASSDDLSRSGLKVFSIYGLMDGLATEDKIEASRPLLPSNTQYVAIQGGNHAQFGDYGEQNGDHPAAISRAAQQAQAAAATVELLESLGEVTGEEN